MTKRPSPGEIRTQILKGGGLLKPSKAIHTDYYVISDDFRLLDFNQNVKNRYKGIQLGDLCYQATMKRDTPCPHCPIAGNSQNDCPVYYDPFYRDWVQAVFSEIGEGKYAVTCHPADRDGRSVFERLKINDLSLTGELPDKFDSENIGKIGGFCEEGFPLYDVNASMIRMLGYDSREDFERGIDGKVVNTIHPEDLPQVTADLGDHFYVGMKYETTYRMPRKDGTWFWTVDRGEVIEAADGRLAIISVCLDVTREHEQQEARKRESDASASREGILSDMIGALYSYQATVNLETGKYTLSVGTGMEEFIRQFSRTDDYEAASNILLSNVLPEYIDEMNRQFSLEALRRQQNQRGHLGQMVYAGVTGAGIGWFEVNVFIGVDDQGTPIANVFGRDVTEIRTARERRERELRAVAARDQLLSDITKMLYGYNMTVNVNTGKYTLIPGNGMERTVAFLQANDQYEEVFRQFCRNTDEQYRARATEMLSLDSYRGRIEHPGLVGTEEFLQHLPEGNDAWHEMNVIVGFDREGEPILNILGRDVTEAHDRADTKAQLEITKAASEAKSAFLFNMSHDIRTPMNAIIGFTDLLKKHLDDKELARSYIGKIETANDFLLSLINNVLEMARIESGKVYLDETANNVYAFWQELHALFDTQMQAKGITFTGDIRVSHPDVITDGTKLREILLNIMSNAVKYTPSVGSISVTVTEIPVTRPGYTVYQTVIADTGIGMSEEFLPHIFEEFTRERTSTESKVAGTGLGMPIVKKLVDLLQGTITVESQLGKGTKFTLTLAHRIADDGQKRQLSLRSDPYRMEDFAGKRILLAEDNQLNAEIAMTILEEAGFLVEWAEDGIICVDRIEKAAPDEYDLVLMDIQMPNMDGYKATRIIRRLPDQRKAGIPIIAMTANAFDEDRRKAFQVGMNGHITKPIQVEVLMNTLASVLSEREGDKEIYRHWYTYFSDCKPFHQLRKKHNRRGKAVGCLVYEAQGEEQILFADEALIHMFGCGNYTEFYKYVGGSFKTMVHPEDVQWVEKEIGAQILRSGDSVDRVTYRIVRRDGAVRVVDDIGRKVITENGNSVYYVCIVDITDSGEGEELLPRK